VADPFAITPDSYALARIAEYRSAGCGRRGMFAAQDGVAVGASRARIERDGERVRH